MSGDEEAELRVNTRSDSGANTLWSLTGDQGSEWLHAQVSISIQAGKASGHSDVTSQVECLYVLSFAGTRIHETTNVVLFKLIECPPVPVI